MNTNLFGRLNDLYGSPRAETWVDVLGWMLVHSLWLLLIPAAVFGLVLLATPASWSRVRYGAGLASLLTMILVPACAVLWIDFPAAALPTDSAVTDLSGGFDLTEQGDRLAVDQGERPDDDFAVAFEESDRPAMELSGDPGDATIIATAPTNALGSAQPPAPDAVDEIRAGVDAPPAAAGLAERILPWLPGAVAVWLTGTLLMTLRLLAGWRAARRVAREGRSEVPIAVRRAFEELRTSIGASQAARVAQSVLVKVPSVVGYFRPIVLLPVSAVTGLSDQQVRAILAHELAHVRRYDYAVNVLQTTIETVLFYHPVVWWVSRVVRTEREHCCDDIALAAQCDASDLARALVAVAAVNEQVDESAATVLIPPTLMSAADGGNLLRRIRRLAGNPREDRVSRRSWIAGLCVLGLLAATGTLAVLSDAVAEDDQSNTTQQVDPQADTRDAVATVSGRRLEFDGGYYVELSAVGDYVRQQAESGSDDGSPAVWNGAGETIDPPFTGTNSSGYDVESDKIARKFYLMARMPLETTLNIDVPGERFGGSGVTTSSSQTFVTAQASCMAEFPRDQQTADVSVELNLPAWKTFATFDFAGGVNNGVIMDWERKVTEYTRFTATGDFGPGANDDNTRIVAFDRDHQPLKTSRTGAMSRGGKLRKLDVSYLNENGRPNYVIVQRREPTRKIVIRDVPLHPGIKSEVRCEIDGVDLAGQPADEPLPLTALLQQPPRPLSATLPGVGNITLIGLRDATENPRPGWHADGSPRIVPPDVDLDPPLRSASDGKKKLNAFFHFVPETTDLTVSKVRIDPVDATGTTTSKTFRDEDGKLKRQSFLQTMDILDDREVDDVEVTLYAGPPQRLATVTVGDVPSGFDSDKRFLYEPGDEVQKTAFQIGRSRTGDRLTLMIVLPSDVPDGTDVTALTSTGDVLIGATNHTRGRTLIATFTVPPGRSIESIDVTSVPKHTVMFRNVSVWRGLGSRAFVDIDGQPPLVDRATTPTRIFLRPSGQRVTQREDSAAALEAVAEIERRGGLLRFDDEAEAPSGETLRYLTEVRWDDVRPDETQLLQPLAGLHRVAFSSEYVDDECLQSIEHLTSLQKLRVSRSDHLTTACLASVGKLTNLRELRLVSSLKWNQDGYNATDFEHLRGLTKLTDWEPYDWRMDDAGIAWLDECDDLELVYGWAPELTDVGFAALGGKSNLQVIRLGPTKITDLSFRALENHPTLYWLQCSSPNLTDAAIDSAVTISNLRDLHLDGSQVTDAGIERLIAAIDDLPKLQTVNVSGTRVSESAADRLRSAKKNLTVIGGMAPSPDEQQTQSSSTAAPSEVPWPVEKYKSFAAYPPSGSGIRVKLDDRRWVELNSLSSSPKRDSGEPKVFWQPNGEILHPPKNFDPLSLVPKREGGEMPAVTREAAIQIVAPTGTEFTLQSGGSGAYGRLYVPIDDQFTQVPIQYPMSQLGRNHTHVEVHVTQEDWEPVPLGGNDEIRVIMAPEDHRMVVVAANVQAYSWKVQTQGNDDDEPKLIDPFTTGVDVHSDWLDNVLSDGLRERLSDSPAGHTAVIFSFYKKKPFPKVLALRRSRLDVVRFDNLAVYPGPKSAVKVSVNGVPVAAADRPTLMDADDVSPIIPPKPKNEAGVINLSGTVVDADGQPVAKSWVGMFVEPQYYNERKADQSAFQPRPNFVMEATTDSKGRFTLLLAPKDHFVFDGSFWAVSRDGRSGARRLNCTWSYLQNNLEIKLDDATAAVKVVDPDGNPVVGAEVIPEAIRKNRRPAHYFPARVQQKLKAVTDEDGTVEIAGWSSSGIRGIAVTADGFGTQYLNPRMASQWAKDGEPLTLTLRPVAALSGRVLGFDPQRDRGLKLQIRTEAYERGARPPLSGRAIVSVADDGSFTAPHIVEGYVSFDASMPPDSLRKVRVASIARLEIGEHRKLTDDVCPQIVDAVAVRQRLVKGDTDEAAPDVQLRVLWGDSMRHNGSWNSSRTTVTDENGWWEAKVLPGTINVRINGIPKGYQGTAWFDGRNGSSGVEHTVPATDQVVILPAEVYVPAIALKGRLLLPDGQPAVGWSAYGHPISWDDVGVGGVSTDKNGNFTWTYPEGYPPRLFKVSNREWLTEHDFKDNYAYPNVVSEAPFVLQIPKLEAVAP
ncbi:Regulatory protein BlaR1 [Stieleria neptunia]|uniref:Regulatory protein BlaR1 n=1 Tax=Stieleria neptunia TaxID=2527979 RepID=A0A518HJK7_9BACT|nr:M56 family metallopeptidase [Stieleria neptunia]QDV41011.1 Regulatory protein BlaR1 [Stieleria neptunia]